MAVKSTVRWGIEVRGANALRRAMRVLEEPEAPFLKAALDDAGRLLADAAAGHAPGGIAASVSFRGVRGRGSQLRAVIAIRHPGGRSMEFGRSWYYRGYTGREVRATGRKFRSPRGQAARPYLGIIHGDAAIGEVGDEIRDMIIEAFEREWERLAAGGDD